MKSIQAFLLSSLVVSALSVPALCVAGGLSSNAAVRAVQLAEIAALTGCVGICPGSFYSALDTSALTEDDQYDTQGKQIQKLVVAVDQEQDSFMAAIKKHDVSRVRGFLNGEELVVWVLVNALDQSGCTPLQYALAYRFYDIAGMLIAAGARL